MKLRVMAPLALILLVIATACGGGSKGGNGSSPSASPSATADTAAFCSDIQGLATSLNNDINSAGGSALNLVNSVQSDFSDAASILTRDSQNLQGFAPYSAAQDVIRASNAVASWNLSSSTKFTTTIKQAGNAMSSFKTSYC
jgi:hypothetical protein